LLLGPTAAVNKIVLLLINLTGDLLGLIVVDNLVELVVVEIVGVILENSVSKVIAICELEGK